MVGEKEAMFTLFEDENQERGRFTKTEFIPENSFQGENLNTGWARRNGFIS